MTFWPIGWPQRYTFSCTATHLWGLVISSASFIQTNIYGVHSKTVPVVSLRVRAGSTGVYGYTVRVLLDMPPTQETIDSLAGLSWLALPVCARREEDSAFFSYIDNLYFSQGSLTYNKYKINCTIYLSVNCFSVSSFYLLVYVYRPVFLLLVRCWILPKLSA